MTLSQTAGVSEIAQSVKKLLLTSAVVAGFAAYAVVQHFMAPPDAPIAVGASSGTGAGPELPTAPARNGTVPTPSVAANRAAPAAQPSATATRAQAAASATPTRAPQARPTATPTNPPPAQAKGLYKDGTYVGNSMNAYWGNVQVKAVVQGGQLTDVQILDYPHDRRTSQSINSYAMPYLQSEAIQAQSAQVDMIGGATLTSQAYIRSLQSALAKAKS